MCEAFVLGLCLVEGTNFNGNFDDDASVADIMLVGMALCFHQRLVF